ncbi:MAG: protein kinase, partial [Planctomycetota bacterium]
ERLKTTRKLVHPRIVNYSDFGNIQGLFYMASEFIEGETLKKRMEKYISIRESLHIIHQVLVVLEYAHQQGVTHGSLSPTSIFLTKDDTIRVLDFAIPLVINPVLKGFPLIEAGYGALYYRDPRIIQQQKEPDFSADIYSVGCLLYELLTEKKAIAGESVDALLSSAQKNFPLLLLGKDAPPGLQMILTRATHPLLNRRYSTLRRFMQDVDNFLNFRPLLANDSPLRKIFPHLSPLHILLLSFLFLIFLVGVLAVPFFSYLRSLKSKMELQEQTLQHQEEQKQKTKLLLAQAFQEKAAWIQQKQPTIAGLLAAQSHEILPTLPAQTLLSELYFQIHPFASPYLPAFAEKQQIVLTPEEKLMTLDSVQGLQEWDLPPSLFCKKRVPISASFPHSNQSGILFSTPLFLYCALNKEVRQYSWESFQRSQTFFQESPVSAICLSKLFLFVGTRDGTLTQWELSTGKPIKTIPVGKEAISVLAFWEARKILFIASGDQLISIPIENPISLQNLSPHREAITQLYVSEPLQLLFSSSLDRRIQALDLNTGNILHTFIGHQGGVMSFQIDPAQNRLYSISNVGELFVWNLAPKIQSERPERSITLKEKSLSAIFLSPKNRALVLNTNNSVYFLNPQTLEETSRLFGFHYGFPLKLATDQEQNTLYLGDSSGTLTSWDLTTRAPKDYFEAGNQPISALFFDSSQKCLWAGNSSGMIYKWTPSHSQEQISFKEHSQEIVDLLVSENTLYSSSFPGKLICSDLSASAPKNVWERPSATSLFLDHQLWAGSFEGTLWCYHAKTGQILGRWEFGKRPLKIGLLSSDFLYGTTENRFILWDIKTKKISFETEVTEPILSVSASEEFIFLGTAEHLLMFNRQDCSLFRILSSPHPLRQIQYLPKQKSLLVNFSGVGPLLWENDFLQKAEWLSLSYWEKCSQSKISGFDVVPSK